MNAFLTSFNPTMVTPANREATALTLFNIQFNENDLYQSYAQSVGKTPDKVHTLHDIPFLPISFFKTHAVKTGQFDAAVIFESSGTTGANTSKHHVRDLAIYKSSFLATFNQFYGAPSSYCIIGLLPSYLERKNASLVYMVESLIESSNHPASGFYLHDFEALNLALHQLETQQTPTLLIGVSFALLDFAEQYPQTLRHTIVMETGGMKGRRTEYSKAELHRILESGLGVDHIHAEYGMTELLSQAYARGNGIFESPDWMQILIRPEDDPLSVYPDSSDIVSGAINIIDLANIHSCCFIATEDLGKRYPNGHFEITGRLQQSDIRGCSQLVV
ncbi:MAG: acyl transferase [Ferruginibacter sp.]